MNDLALHLAPGAPWPALLLLSLALAALAVWAYRFGLPPVPTPLRRLLGVLRAAVLVTVAWLLAQPVLERALPASGRRVTVLVDASASMDLPAAPGGPSRADVAARAAKDVAAALRGRASVEVRRFAAALEGDSAGALPRQATALGDVLGQLAAAPVERRPDGVIVVSDGLVNAGADPVAAARALGAPVHAVVVGGAPGPDRAVAEVETSPTARVGEAEPVRVRVLSTESRGTPLTVRVREDGRELAHATILAPGPGAEATTTLRVTPSRPGLAVWTASVDSLAGDASPRNDARRAAVQVAPGKLGVLVLTGGLNWDLAFLRRALLGDSTLAVDTRVRERGGWRALERAGGAPAPADLRGRAVVVLDGIAAGEAGEEFDRALAAFVRNGGGLLVLAGPAPGLALRAHGALAPEMPTGRGGAALEARPQPTAAADELLAWDDDPARGDAAWRAAAPLSDVMPLAPAAGDRVLVGAAGGGPPLVFARRAGRGPVLFVNGTGFWRWSLAGNDELAGERGRRLWRKAVRWLSEPVQGEPLRVRPERWLAADGERVRLFASLQDESFRPVAGARVSGEANDGRGHSRALAFEPGEAGSYSAVLDDLPPGRWQVGARALKDGRELAAATTAFAVDTWSLEALRAEPDSATLAAVARASEGRVTVAAGAGAWARSLETRALARRRAASTRLWEWPWLFAALVAMLAVEWTMRRRRGLP